MSWTVSEHAIELAAARLLERLERVEGEVTLAIPGGSTPGPVLEAMKISSELNARLTATLVDERHLPIGADLPAESNSRLLRAHFRCRTIEWARTGTLDEVGAQLSAEVPVPDVVLLGMGPDGHIASLFPGRNHHGAKVLTVRDSPKPPPDRLTLSLDTLNQASYVLVVIRGAGKAEAARRAWSRESELPTSHLNRPTVEWILDPAAASLLPEIS